MIAEAKLIGNPKTWFSKSRKSAGKIKPRTALKTILSSKSSSFFGKKASVIKKPSAGNKTKRTAKNKIVSSIMHYFWIENNKKTML